MYERRSDRFASSPGQSRQRRTSPVLAAPLAVVLALVLALALPVTGAAAGYLPPPAFEAGTTLDTVLATFARQGPERSAPGRAAFVVAAVDALARLHEEAIGRAGGGGEARWIGGTRSYVALLEAAARDASAGARIRFLRQSDGVLRVFVGRRHQFMLVAPRPGDQRVLEAGVLAGLCDRVGCGTSPRLRLAADGGGAGADGTSERPARVRIGSDDGLVCPGRVAPHARLQARACAQVLAEIRGVAIGLRDALPAFDRPLDWAAVGPLAPEGEAHLLPVNAHGDAIRVRAPALFGSPEVLADALPWIRAVLAGKVTAHAVTPPARLVYAEGLAARIPR